MALDQERWDAQEFYFLILDASFSRTKRGDGWQFYIRTPLIGLLIFSNWWGFKFVDRTNKIYIGFVTKFPAPDSEEMYRWKWEKEVMAQQFNQQGMPVQAPGTISASFFNMVSQIAHFFATYAITFTLWIWSWRVGLAAFLGCLVYAAVHEFWYDPHFENAATRGSDLEDFFFLCAGALVGLALGIALRH